MYTCGLLPTPPQVLRGFIWFDYLCIPQKESYSVEEQVALMAAVESIPSYVEDATLFITLVPPCQHKDMVFHYDDDEDTRGSSFLRAKGLPVNLCSWESRGWCRAEIATRLLAQSSGPVIVVDSHEGRFGFCLSPQVFFVAMICDAIVFSILSLSSPHSLR